VRGIRIIFLDIDGVLNCKKTPNPRELPYVVDSRLLRIFQRMVARARAKVVLISDWRHDPAGLFSARYWGIRYIDVVPYLRSDRAASKFCFGSESIQKLRDML
jgi:hypothetical protein